MLAFWIALRVVQAVAILVPTEGRAEWRREWEAELRHRWTARRLLFMRHLRVAEPERVMTVWQTDRDTGSTAAAPAGWPFSATLCGETGWGAMRPSSGRPYARQRPGVYCPIDCRDSPVLHDDTRDARRRDRAVDDRHVGNGNHIRLRRPAAAHAITNDATAHGRAGRNSIPARTSEV